VGRFFDCAAELFSAAENILQAGSDPAGMTILIDSAGALQLLSDCDWPLDSLQRERGVETAYRVLRRGDSVRVEGREGRRVCVLDKPGSAEDANQCPAPPPLWLLRRNHVR